MECIKEFQQDRKKEMMAVHDAMDVLSGKWKIYIISSICHYNKRRYFEQDVEQGIKGIGNKQIG
jgi:DNA-binding HxlR family transcriptional regulator